MERPNTVPQTAAQLIAAIRARVIGETRVGEKMLNMGAL